MIDLVRDLLDRPLDPRHARAVVAVASCLTIAFAALVGLGVIGPRPTSPQATRTPAAGRPTAPPAAAAAPQAPAEVPSRAARRIRRQDPQDRRGSATYRRARRMLRGHRALQHLPFRHGGLSITLVGADRGRAVILVAAPTITAAHRGWREFLRRFADHGAAYEARFRVPARNGVTGRRKDAGGAAEGAARPDATAGAGRRGIRHRQTDRGAGSFLRSKPHPKASP